MILFTVYPKNHSPPVQGDNSIEKPFFNFNHHINDKFFTCKNF